MDNVYRRNAAAGDDAPGERAFSKRRTAWIVAFSVAVHAIFLCAAFVSRAPPPSPTTRVVRVLAGHVDPNTGAFQASGLADARIKR
jgi:hypothetical protein